MSDAQGWGLSRPSSPTPSHGDRREVAPDEAPFLLLLRMAEKGVVALRSAVDHPLEHAQLWLRKQHSAVDPKTRRWAEEARASIADRTIWDKIANQPSPRDLYEQPREDG